MKQGGTLMDNSGMMCAFSLLRKDWSNFNVFVSILGIGFPCVHASFLRKYLKTKKHESLKEL